ncbi:MAG TPA: biopolymer transporter ExbD [Pirellulaceae bacterium]|nr:biopolymer transporter ExbD [Planctomycetales bacterium]MCB9939676.1 biopolymer transporter ExbD [Planctomycetaceae bacterium]HRX77729.1 biopolymer transporter ExbD [Pirellulaceae bacterium]
MRLTKRRRNTRPEMDMTPMIDIVFLLIIFFMTVTQVSKLNKEQLELPKLQGTEDQKPSVLTVNVSETGEIRISGRTLSSGEFVSLVNRELRRVGDDPNLLGIVIRADQRGASAGVNDIVEALNKLQIKRVRIAVEVPQ